MTPPSGDCHWPARPQAPRHLACCHIPTDELQCNPCHHTHLPHKLQLIGAKLRPHKLFGARLSAFVLLPANPTLVVDDSRRHLFLLLVMRCLLPLGRVFHFTVTCG